MNTDLFDRIIRDTITENNGATTDEIADAALAAGVFDEEWRAGAEQERARYEARRRVKGVKDTNGMPVYFNVGSRVEDGPPLYKSPPLFELSEYDVAAKPYVRSFEHSVAVLHHLRGLAAAAGVQLRLPFSLPEPVMA